jgi:hypothetical protein
MIEMDAALKFSPYRKLFALPTAYWNIVEVEDSTLVLEERTGAYNEKLTFYRYPTR